MYQNFTVEEFLTATTAELAERASVALIPHTGEITLTFLVDGENIEIALDTGGLEFAMLNKYFKRPDRERVLEEAGYNFNTGKWDLYSTY